MSASCRPGQIVRISADPKVFWHAPSAKWILVLSRGYTAPENMYASSDLKQWWTLRGMVLNGECPDLFQLPVEGRPRETKWMYMAGDYPMTPNNGLFMQRDCRKTLNKDFRLMVSRFLSTRVAGGPDALSCRCAGCV